VINWRVRFRGEDSWKVRRVANDSDWGCVSDRSGSWCTSTVTGEMESNQQNRELWGAGTNAKTMRLMADVISRRSPTTIRSPASYQQRGILYVGDSDGCKGIHN
jgi:hypothetical protein